MAADAPLSAAAIRDLLTDNTMYCRNLKKDESFVSYYRADGTVTKRAADGSRSEGTWRVTGDGLHCLDWGEHERCNPVVELGEGRYRKTEDDEPHAEFSVQPGNPEGL